jgi:hypothetical protein
MKFNKWTLGLAAVGAVSMASAVRADEAKMSVVNTALSSTTLSGYVDVAAQYTTGNQPTHGVFGEEPAGTGPGNGIGTGKVDQFTLNNVDLALDKPLDATAWSAGYHIELNLGTDAINGGLRQGYVTMNTPVGNGISWKFGVQDDIIGYEGNTDGANPNYSRSVAYSIEPTTLNGLTATYQFCSAVSATLGIVNSAPTGVLSPGPGTDSSKDYAAAVNLTAPDSWGFLKGGTASFGVLQNYDKGGTQNWYAGLTVPTPLSTVKVGGAFDYVGINNRAEQFGINPKSDSGWVAGLYTTFAPTDKLSFNLRGEYYDLTGGVSPYFAGNGKGEEVTATVAYNLWANVLTRAEFRWDHSDAGQAFGGGAPATPYINSFIMAVNVIYTF